MSNSKSVPIREVVGEEERSISAIRPFVDSAFRGTPRFAWNWLFGLSQIYPKRLCMPRACRPMNHAIYVTEGFRRVQTAEGVVEDAMSRCDGIPFSAWVLVFWSSAKEIHGNAMVYDRKRKTVTRFEPRGHMVSYDWEALDRVLATFVKEAFDGASYIAPSTFQHKVGPQRQEVLIAKGQRSLLPAHGPCVIWSLMFIAMQLEDPEMEPGEISARLETLSVDPRVFAQAIGHFIEATMKEVPVCPLK